MWIVIIWDTVFVYYRWVSSKRGSIVYYRYVIGSSVVRMRIATVKRYSNAGVTLVAVSVEVMEDRSKKSQREVDLVQVIKFKELKCLTPCKLARINGLVAMLSSEMVNGSFFHGRLNDSSGGKRLVGFSDKKQEALSDFCKNEEPVLLDGCKEQLSDYTHEYEVIIKDNARIRKSPKNITANNDVPRTSTRLLAEPTIFKLENLQSLDQDTWISVNAKVLKLHDEVDVRPGLVKQDAVIADSTSRLLMATQGKQCRKVENVLPSNSCRVCAITGETRAAVCLKHGYRLLPMWEHFKRYADTMLRINSVQSPYY